MLSREPAFYRDFRCLGGACPLTCCRDWDIVVDKESLADYATAPEGLRQTIAAALITDEEGDVCFRLASDGRCALLDEDGLCPIQRRWGEEHLCEHCASYPRFIEEYGCLTEACQALSCPEAARLVLDEGIFPLVETDDGSPDAPFEGVDGALLAGLTASRSTAFALLTDADRPLWGRLAGLLDYADALQKHIDCGDVRTMEVVSPPPLTRSGTGNGLQPMAVRLLDLLSRLRDRSALPVLILTANDLEMDQVTGLELGADDYVTKPFSLAVLRARVNSLLRRSRPAPAALELPPFLFDFDAMVFARDGVPLELSKTEQRLLRLLVEHRGQTLSREVLLDRVWDGGEFVDENALSVAVNRLRAKLADAPIRTVYGLGYQWAVD